MSVLRESERYLRDSEMPETRFGRLSVNDPRLVRDVRNGRELGRDVTARVEAFMAHGAPQ